MCRHGFDDLSLERIRSQLGGAVIMDLGLAMHGKMTFKDDHVMPRQDEAPSEIQVQLASAA